MAPTRQRVAIALAIALALLAFGRRVQAQATNPTPADKATGVSVTPTLTWSADPKANRYDVAFGTTNPPPSVARNLSTTAYQPGSLSPGTTYYWRIDSRGPKNYAATGTTWSFSTGTPPPPPPATPTGASPPTGSVGVSISTALAWAVSANATGYTVAFGTTLPPPIVSTNQAATTYRPPSPLAYAQTYYWSVTATGPGGSTTGPTWTFTTQNPPPSTSRDRLRVLTWNIQSGRDTAGAAAVDAQAALMADSGADIVALQDVTITSDVGDLTTLYKSRLEALTGTTWYQVWAPAPRASTDTPEGNLLLSRIPIFTSATTQFDTAPGDATALDAKRSAAAITIVVNQVQVTVVTTELPLDAATRQAHLDLFQAWSAGFQAPRMAGGDFNMLPGDSVYADMTGSMADVWTAIAGGTEYGFTQDTGSVAPNAPARVDYWFQESTDTHARATEAWVVKTARSNHHPVVADIAVK